MNDSKPVALVNTEQEIFQTDNFPQLVSQGELTGKMLILHKGISRTSLKTYIVWIKLYMTGILIFHPGAQHIVIAL